MTRSTKTRTPHSLLSGRVKPCTHSKVGSLAFSHGQTFHFPIIHTSLLWSTLIFLHTWVFSLIIYIYISPLSLSTMKSIGTDFRGSIALDSPPRSIIRQSWLSAVLDNPPTFVWSRRCRITDSWLYFSIFIYFYIFQLRMRAACRCSRTKCSRFWNGMWTTAGRSPVGRTIPKRATFPPAT